MITTDELLERTGISGSTFLRLKDLGIIPPAESRGRGTGGGRGIIGFYPDETISVVKWAMIKHNEGYTMKKIAEILRTMSSRELIKVFMEGYE